MREKIMRTQAELEVMYLQAVIDLAKEQVDSLSKSKDGNVIAFDPQGSVMVNLEKKNIQDKLLDSCPEEDKNDILKFLKKKTDTTTISLDITKYPDLNSLFLDKLSITDDDKKTELNDLPKGSINPVYREIYFHLNATKRILMKLVNESKPDQNITTNDSPVEKAFQETLTEINSGIMEAYKNAIAQTTPLTDKSIAIINKELDTYRKTALNKVHSIFLEKLGADEINLDKKDIKQIKHLALETTATPNDIVFVGSNQVMWAAGNDFSSHHRPETNADAQKVNFGSQASVTHTYNPNTGKVVANQNERLQIRAPSLAMKRNWDWRYYLKGKAAVDKPFITDVVNKLRAQKNEHQLADILPDDGGFPKKPKAIIYNLYTALNDNTATGLIDEFNNKQNQSAEYILKGAHEYNKEQLRLVDQQAVLCLVQNISVNGFGYPLGYGSGNPLVEEATLMTDMALLHTMWEQAPVTLVGGKVPSAQKTLASQAFNKYVAFLKKINREPFFSKSSEGKEAMALIEKFKQGYNLGKTRDGNLGGGKEHVFPKNNDPIASAKNSLFNLMSENHHYRNDASLFQALSVFVEKASMGGCKSAIDRTPMINNRVAILDRALNDPTPIDKDIEEVQKALNDLGEPKYQLAVNLAENTLKDGYALDLEGEHKTNTINVALNSLKEAKLAKKTAVEQAAKTLETALDNAVNRLGLQTGSSMQTNAEIGGAAKYNAKSDSFFSKFFGQSTNNAEKPTMTNVSQSNATQSHKKLAKAFTKAWKAITLSSTSAKKELNQTKTNDMRSSSSSTVASKTTLPEASKTASVIVSPATPSEPPVAAGTDDVDSALSGETMTEASKTMTDAPNNDMRSSSSSTVASKTALPEASKTASVIVSPATPSEPPVAAGTDDVDSALSGETMTDAPNDDKSSNSNKKNNTVDNESNIFKSLRTQFIDSGTVPTTKETQIAQESPDIGMIRKQIRAFTEPQLTGFSDGLSTKTGETMTETQNNSPLIKTEIHKIRNNSAENTADKDAKSNNNQESSIKISP